jgi:rare lipoprotein A
VIKSVISTGLVAGLLALSGCGFYKGSDNSGRYQQAHDSGPTAPKSVDHIPDAVPIPEPITAAGNKSPYKVRGKTYRVMASAEGYKERGKASWYGEKFHGHNTSNGEVYDMYGMTAAHKTLPIPTYVKVKNLANGREVIVRVNDRGPFHAGRIIDLTYTAAKKLGFVEHGVAEVEVTAIDAVAWQRDNAKRLAAAEVRALASEGELPAPAPKYSGGFVLPDNTFLQAGAFSSANSAEQFRTQLAGILNFPVIVKPPIGNDRFYRVRIGPIADNLQAATIKSLLVDQRFPEPHLVQE